MKGLKDGCNTKSFGLKQLCLLATRSTGVLNWLKLESNLHAFLYVFFCDENLYLCDIN